MAVPADADLQVEIRGNDFYGAGRIRALLPPDPDLGPEAGPAAVRAWEAEADFNLEDAYRRAGFLDAEAVVDLRRPGRGEGDWLALIRVQEGSRYRISSVELEVRDAEAPVLRPENLRARPGAPYVRDMLLEDERGILRRYGNAGFLRAEVEPDVDIDDAAHAVAVRYSVVPGPPVIFDTLLVRNVRAPPQDTVEGLTENDLLRDIVGYRRGDTVRVERNDAIIRKLQSTHAFTYVALEDSLLPGKRGSALVLTAVERVPGRVRTSVFYETQYGFGGRLRLSHLNFDRDLDEGTVTLMAAQDKQEVAVEYGSALTLGYLLRFDNETEAAWYQDARLHEELETPPFRGDFEVRNMTRLSRALFYWLRYVAGGELLARSKLLAPEERNRGFNLNITNTLLLSLLDRLIDPMRGSRYALTWGNGGPLIQEGEFSALEFRHNWLELESAYYYPILDQVRTAFRLSGGLFFGEGGINSDRFFLGGPRSVRAFGYHELCPQRDSVATDGGATFFCEERGLEPAYYLASAELRLVPWGFVWMPAPGWVRFLRPVQLVLFTDYGKVWNRERPFDVQEDGEGIAYGFGFRYPLLNIFNVRLDFAWGRRGDGGKAFAWVVDLAQAF